MANPSGDLQLTFTAGGPPRSAVMYTSNGNFIGSYFGQPADFAVHFTVAAYSATPSTLGLYFHNGNGNEWTYGLTTPPAGSMTAYSLSTALQDYNNWQNLTLISGNVDLATWQADFSNIDRFGIYVLENSGFSGTETYGLDNLNLSVPEPEAVWLILAALASLGVTFRGKVGETVRGLIARA